MLYMLEHLSIFMEVKPTCFVQLTGKQEKKKKNIAIIIPKTTIFSQSLQRGEIFQIFGRFPIFFMFMGVL